MNEKRLLRGVLIIGIVVIIVLPTIGNVLTAARDIIYPAILALIVAYLCYPLMRWTNRIGIPKWFMAMAILFSIFASIAIIIQYCIPPLKSAVEKEYSAFKKDVELEMQHHVNQEEVEENEANSHLLSAVKKIKVQLGKMGIIDQDVSMYNFLSKIPLNDIPIGDIISKFFEGIGGTFWFTLIFTFVLFFTLLDGDKLYNTIIRLIPNEFFEAGILGINRTMAMFESYIQGVVIETFIIALLGTVILGICSLFTPLTFGLAILIALIIALTNIVRIVGPIFGGLAGMIIALISTSDLKVVLIVMCVGMIVQLADNFVILPLVMRDQIKIHPVICLLGVLIGGSIGDDIIGKIVGMILAIPVIGGIKVIYNVIVVDMKRFNQKKLFDEFEEDNPEKV